MKINGLILCILLGLSGCSSIRHLTNRNMFPTEDQAEAQAQGDAEYREQCEQERQEARTRKAQEGGRSGFGTFLTILGAAAAVKQNNDQNLNCRSTRLGNTVYTNCN